MAAPGHGQKSEPCCSLFQCFCRWHLACSDSIQRFTPARDYLRIPDEADNRPEWSVLVGCTCADEEFHDLRLHRFRVASSGRVMGHSNDMLELFSSVHPKDRMDTVFGDATASLAPEGGRLSVICSHWPVLEKMTIEGLNLPPKLVTVDLVNNTLSPETPLPFLHGAYHAVSAHGEFWAAAVVVEESPDISWRLVVHRLINGDGSWDEVTGSWEEVASYKFTERPESVDQSLFSGTALPGYAVINDKFILLSLIDSTFFSFNCASRTLTRVSTTGKASMYVRISGRAVHVKGSEDDGGTIYFLDGTKLFAYKYMPEEDMQLEPPTMVDTLWPYYSEGYGFIVQLEGQMLCAVWINMNEACSCATRHVLITTFSVRSATKPKSEGSSSVHSIEVLHSTCRRVDMIRDKSLGYHHYDTFAILQEYPDPAATAYDVLLPAMSGGLSDPVEDSHEILTCCRNYLRGNGKLDWNADSLVNCEVLTKGDLYFICQVDQHSVFYHISTSGGKLTCDESELKPLLHLDTIRDEGVNVDFPATWHFVRDKSKLFVIPSFPHHSHYTVDLSSMSPGHLDSSARHGYFSSVLQVGEAIVALGDRLMDVYILDAETSRWGHMQTSSRTLNLEQKVKISGYVDIDGRGFMISDGDTDKSFFLDLITRRWVVIEPPKVNNWFCLVGLLSGRCIFSAGFIYTCADDGLVAYELFKNHHHHHGTPCGLGTPILLEFPWRQFSDRRFMSFELIGEGTKDIVFCVIQGYFLADSFTTRHSLTVTTVIVEREGTPQGAKVPVRINHVDVAQAFVSHEDRILTNYAFAL